MVLLHRSVLDRLLVFVQVLFYRFMSSLVLVIFDMFF